MWIYCKSQGSRYLEMNIRNPIVYVTGHSPPDEKGKRFQYSLRSHRITDVSEKIIERQTEAEETT